MNENMNIKRNFYNYNILEVKSLFFVGICKFNINVKYNSKKITKITLHSWTVDLKSKIKTNANIIIMKL